VSGTVITEQRQRSIYKVLLYRSALNNKGDFSFKLTEDVDIKNLLLANARICIGLSDLRGIEEKAVINFNGTSYELQPGLPSNEIDSSGLSAPVNITGADLDKILSFDISIKIKGSQQLHFLPLSGNSRYALQLGNAKYSFDGNALPGENKLTNKNAVAKWSFNKANLPFGNVLKDLKVDKKAMAFGVTMLQPAEQYVKTMRSVKYALLFIGLTFSLFFIVELMQKKPLHPVQYVLVGLALVIFFSLLLSISEYVVFNTAYLIASGATVLLITLYTKGHFNSWKTASLFAAVISCLYGFIFILISLEDTSLLVGSIGLFIVLALVMYASRKINWYGAAQAQPETSVI
jgi:inner membrane protein